MAFPTAVNSQITDSVTQTNVKVLANAPALALSNLYQSVASSIGVASQNAVTNQQNANALTQAVTTKCIEKLLAK
ncbi:MAG: RebB family R body protein [Flavobacteriaceae bacterium]|nr:RebB family R body protein [Flavobacteriaceae bacterium]